MLGAAKLPSSSGYEVVKTFVRPYAEWVQGIAPFNLLKKQGEVYTIAVGKLHHREYLYILVHSWSFTFINQE